MRVVSIDPHPAKPSVVCMDDGAGVVRFFPKTSAELHAFSDCQAKTEVLVCWDAPLTGPRSANRSVVCRSGFELNLGKIRREWTARQSWRSTPPSQLGSGARTKGRKGAGGTRRKHQFANACGKSSNPSGNWNGGSARSLRTTTNLMRWSVTYSADFGWSRIPPSSSSGVGRPERGFCRSCGKDKAWKPLGSVSGPQNRKPSRRVPHPEWR